MAAGDFAAPTAAELDILVSDTVPGHPTYDGLPPTYDDLPENSDGDSLKSCAENSDDNLSDTYQSTDADPYQCSDADYMQVLCLQMNS
jgi:hypothetical protein